MNGTILKSTPGFPLSGAIALPGAIAMCGAYKAEHTAARERVLQLAPISVATQGIGVLTAAVTVDGPTTKSASASERSPG